MLDAVRRAVRARAAPTYGAYIAATSNWNPPYAELPAVQLGQLSYVPHPQQIYSNGTGMNQMREDAFADELLHEALQIRVPQALVSVRQDAQPDEDVRVGEL